MKHPPDISDTAFITCYFRSLDPERSRDPFAHLWISDSARRLGDQFKNEVIENDPVNIQLRSRYWVEALERFQREHGEFTLVNLGAGFTMYPYLPFMTSGVRCLEVDQAHVIDFKIRSLAEFSRTGQLPEAAHPHTLRLNFEQEDFEDALDREIEKLGRDRPVFFLLEGFFYYLSAAVSDRLWAWLQSACHKGSQIGMIYLPPEVQHSRAFRDTQDFLRSECGYDGDHIVYHDKDYFTRGGLKVLDHSSHVELGKRYGASDDYTNDNTFNEHFILLNRLDQVV